MLDKEKDRIHIVERTEDGKRVYKDFPTNWVFYYNDQRGKFTSIFGTPVSRFSTKSNKEFRKEIRAHDGKKLFESDLNPVFRCLEENYKGKEASRLNAAFFDIETDFDSTRGFSPTDDPFNPITAISVYLRWMDEMITLVIPPKSMSMATANDIAKEFSNTIVFEREEDLLRTFLDVIEDADVLSGWNSEGYDIPYTVNRITRVLSKDDTRRFCLWNQFPKARKFEKFGTEHSTYDLTGRIHSDYMLLYRKYTYEERHSYSLDAIAEHELGEHKTQYEGTLDQLYNQDFKKFIEYNRQDVMIIAKLDEKLKFLDLANTIAHENTVLLQTAMGSVAMIEQAIINEAHDRGMVVPDKVRGDKDDSRAAGAYVAYPVKGVHDYIGSIDINSLYPSVLRAMNMGEETIVGQLRQTKTDQFIQKKMDAGSGFAGAWEGLFASLEYTDVIEGRRDVNVTIDWHDGSSDEYTASQIRELIFNGDRPWCLTANGTIFTYEKEAVIPGLLKRWYSERKQMQAKLKEAIDAGDKKQEEYWDKRQLVKKILLNSLYGALLNAHCRFFDKRIGQSTTLTGRSICKHMASHINECITGKYEHTGKSIVYGDTDSCYFSAWPAVKDDVESGNLEWNKDTAVALYDSISDNLNESFPVYMEQAFHCPRDIGTVIRGGREIVATKGLFITKKRYALMYYDKDGKRYDSPEKPGKVKAMGLDLRRSDTPKFVQEFLMEILIDLLTGKGREVIVEKIVAFKGEFKQKHSWEKGTPKRVNNLTKYTAMYNKNPNSALPGHVRAAVNWNNLKRMNSDNYSKTIVDGMKTIVCKLRNNPLNLTSVAYPIDEQHLPEWFKSLPFDDELMLETIVDQKVENLLGELDWDLAASTDTKTTFQSLFEF
jgi:DNA polymerase elongation subunit (family B)